MTLIFGIFTLGAIFGISAGLLLGILMDIFAHRWAVRLTKWIEKRFFKEVA